MTNEEALDQLKDQLKSAQTATQKKAVIDALQAFYFDRSKPKNLRKRALKLSKAAARGMFRFPYIEAWTASEQWARARLEKSQAIIAAVNAWKSEHARVAAFLKKCAGLQFKPFEQGCDNMDFSHLLGLIKTLKGE